MTARPLNAVLRALADTGPPDADGDLLRRFITDRDDEAFAALVKRHGRLVWAVCRHLCKSDAEADDAFQATFLVLVRNAAGVKDAGKLSAWLHGVAYKVCGKSRLAAKRRTARELAAAARERNGHAVPDSAWDRALAAVHEEVAGLPDSLRVPFVLCCLEGKGQTEAAEQLGWKLGTLSGRLTRAKNAVMERLTARGLTLGVLATVGVTGVPAGVSAKAVGLGQVGFAVPGSILQLSTGVIGMSVHKVKLLAAGVLAACGLAVSGGAGWVASADAQSAPPAAKSGQSGPADRVKQLEAELAKARAEAAKADADAARAAQAAEVARYYEEVTKKMAAEAKKKADEEIAKVAEKAAVGEKGEKGGPTTSTKKWDYDFVLVSEGGMTRFVKLMQEYEDKGWDYAGLTKYEVDGKMADVWVFRKPKGGQYGSTWYTPPGQGQYKYDPASYYPVPAAKADKAKEPAAPTPAAKPVPPVPPTATAPARNKDAAAEELEAEIQRLTEKLAELKKQKSKKE
jgi:RNA polymerase sigma factor (sigma-70 family)